VVYVDRGEKVEVNGRSFTGPLYVARQTTLGEVSFVPIGADGDTEAKLAASARTLEIEDMKFSEWLAAKGFDINDLSDAQKASLQAMFDAEQAGGEEEEPPIEAGGPGEGDEDEEEEERTPLRPATVTKAIRAAAAAEHKRVAVVTRIAAKHPEIAAEAIEKGWDETKVELEVLRASRPTTPTGQGGGSGQDAAHAIEAALCLSVGLTEEQIGKDYGEKAMNAAMSRQLRGAGLQSLLYHVIAAAGLHASPGRFGDNEIRVAFEADRKLQASGFSTISLTGILSNIANKYMLAAYMAVNSVIAKFCAQTDNNDFKTVTRYRMTGQGTFEKVGPTGELKHAQLAEESYTNQVDTYGRIITLTRKMMINDDLGAFLQIPRAIGRMSALSLEEAVFTLLLSNPSNFFSTGNANYFEGAATNLQISSLTTAEQMFRDQVDSDGRPILINPAVLLLPTSLATLGDQLMKETRVNEITQTNKPMPASNPHAGKWEPVSTPYLNAQGITGSSATAWYLFGDPADVAAMEVAYLRGQRFPTIQSGETDFSTLGMQWRGFFDFGVAMQDKRAAVKSKGAA
jgi:hypothetical protein